MAKKITVHNEGKTYAAKVRRGHKPILERGGFLTAQDARSWAHEEVKAKRQQKRALREQQKNTYECAGGCGQTQRMHQKFAPLEYIGCGCAGFSLLQNRMKPKGMLCEVVKDIAGGTWSCFGYRLPTRYEENKTTLVHMHRYAPISLKEQAEMARLDDEFWALKDQLRQEWFDNEEQKAKDRAAVRLARQHTPPAAIDLAHNAEKEWISVSGIKARGWTLAMIAKLLGEPQKLAVNPHYSSAAKMKLYLRSLVMSKETSEEFLQLRAKYVRRQKALTKKRLSGANDV